MRAPTKSPTMGGRQQCRHGEPAHVCPWCSYENGKQDGRKAERARIVAWLRQRDDAATYPLADVAEAIENRDDERKAAT